MNIWVILLQTAHQPDFDNLELFEFVFTDIVHKIIWHVFQEFAEKIF